MCLCPAAEVKIYTICSERKLLEGAICWYGMCSIRVLSSDALSEGLVDVMMVGFEVVEFQIMDVCGCGL